MKAMLVVAAIFTCLLGCATNSGPPSRQAEARDLNTAFAGAFDTGSSANGGDAASNKNERGESSESRHVEEATAPDANDSQGRAQRTESGAAESKNEDGVRPGVTFWVYVAIGAGLLAYLLSLVRRRSRLS